MAKKHLQKYYFKKGNIAWNKGMHGIFSEKSLEKMRKAKLGRLKTPHSEATKKKIGESLLKHYKKYPKERIKSLRVLRGTNKKYVSLYRPEHPFSDSNNYIYEHRLVMENKLQRYLGKNEVVHHINGNTLDNRLENLALFTRSKHASMHMTGISLSLKTKTRMSETQRKRWQQGCYALRNQHLSV